MRKKPRHHSDAKQTSAIPRHPPPTTPHFDPQTAAPAWQLVDRSNNGTRQATTAALLIDLCDDTQGESAWRHHEPPRRMFQIPEELLFLSGREQHHEAIAREHESFMFPLQQSSDRKDSHNRTFGIWGPSQQVATVVSRLNEWISRERTSKAAAGATRFDKLRSFSAGDRKKAEKKWLQDVQMHRFRQAPPAGTAFQAIGTFVWPKELGLVETLGRALEALDPLRLERACHIILRDDKAAIKILGNQADVQAAILRLRTTTFQLVARQFQAISRYVVDEQFGCPESVVVREYEHPNTLNHNSRPLGNAYQGIDWTEERQSNPIGKMLSTLLMHTIKRQQYLNSHISFRIRLGTFLAIQHMQPIDGCYPLDEFKSMLAQSQFIGQTTEEIGDKAMERDVLQRVQTSCEFLVPYAAIDDSLSDVRPEYTATFDFAEGISLTLTWQEQPDLYNKVRVTPCGCRWSKKEPNTLLVRQIDINLIDLRKGSAWCFDMHSLISLDESRVPPSLASFANRAKVDEEMLKHPNPAKPFLIFPAHRSLRSLRLQACYKYKYNNSDYCLELSRFQHFRYIWSAGLNPSVTVTEPRWSAAIHSVQWDLMLEENNKLKIGTGATWSDRGNAWFPDGNGGFDQDMSHLFTIMQSTEALFASTNEPAIDEGSGMTIG